MLISSFSPHKNAYEQNKSSQYVILLYMQLKNIAWAWISSLLQVSVQTFKGFTFDLSSLEHQNKVMHLVGQMVSELEVAAHRHLISEN